MACKQPTSILQRGPCVYMLYTSTRRFFTQQLGAVCGALPISGAVAPAK